MKTTLKSIAFLALIVFAFSTTAFSQVEPGQQAQTQQAIHNGTTQNVGTVIVYGSAGPVGQVVVPGPGTFFGQISAPMTGVAVNGVIVAKGAIMKVGLPNGHYVSVNNTISIVDVEEVN